jgi:hypothetical protein
VFVAGSAVVLGLAYAIGSAIAMMVSAGLQHRQLSVLSPSVPVVDRRCCVATLE